MSRGELLLLLSFSCTGLTVHTGDIGRRWASQPHLSTDGLCRYGNSMECCWGWIPTHQGQCQPQCQQGCKHGVCVGPDRCKCRPGYTGKTCNQDLNECGLRPRPCKHRCMNTAGSYKCYCLDGYTLNQDGGCRDTRNCFYANCQYGCEVVKGDVRCTCPSPGLRLGPDRRTCVDIDECVQKRGLCPQDRKCVNTFGSFLCKCHHGFKLVYINGRYTCIDKDNRPFCSLNPFSPKCGCRGRRCRDVATVVLLPHTPRATKPATQKTTTPTTKLPSRKSTVSSTPQMSTTTSSTASTPAQPNTTPTATVAMATTMATTTLPTAVTISPTPVTMTTPQIFTTTTTESTTVPDSVSTVTAAAKSPPTKITTATSTATRLATSVSIATSPSSGPLTTTLDNRINKDLTQRPRGDVHIPRHHSQVWEFDIELGNTAEEMGDDPVAGVLYCSMDQGACDWLSDSEGDLDWTSVQNTAGGWYLSVAELKAGQRSVRGARLAVPLAPPWNQEEMCFSFSHWLTGHHVGVLQLFIRKTGRRYSPALWSRAGGHGWKNTLVSLERDTERVLLRAERRRGQRGQIAIDDILLKRGPCR
ncbi:Nephronectin [Merluccius polli]|uniref:Nephronectin n=1 Tax=Merluccius polli TaxID=89951 RepID=A0AA47N565_MERPO|nr:Nephronectin [Merluccius polli]